jgi:hypothetical protein
MVHGDDQEKIKCSTWKKEEREKQNPMKIKAKVLLRVLVSVIKTP